MNCVIDDTRRSRQPRISRHSDLVRFVLGLSAFWCASISQAETARPFPGSVPASAEATPAREVPVQPTVPTIERPRRPVQEDRSLNAIDPSSRVQPAAAFSLENVLQKPLSDVIVEGNDTILTDAILQKVECRPGRMATEVAIQRDISQLMNTRWFYSVRPSFRDSEDGPILVFQVVERPILRSVTFNGNKKIKTGELQAQTGLRPNSSYDVAANRESVYRIRQLYKEKGYLFAEVTLEKGGLPDERDVVFNIVEGPKSKIREIGFTGNQFASDSILKTKISSKTLKLWFIQGEYDPEVIRNDVLALKQYYMSLGFFDVDVQAEEILSEDRAKVNVQFTINEGRRYKVDGIDVIGNEVIGGDLLLKDLKLSSGDYFNERFLKQDVQKMTDLYDDQGRLFAKVVPTPRFREGEEALVDLVYQIDEDVPRYIGAINVHIAGDYPHSKEELVRQQVNRWLRPGQLARSSDLRMAQARVNGSGFWAKETPPVFDIVPNSGVDYWIRPEVRGQDAGRESTVKIEAVEVSAQKNPQSVEEIFGQTAAPGEFDFDFNFDERPVAPQPKIELQIPDRPQAQLAPAGNGTRAIPAMQGINRRTVAQAAPAPAPAASLPVSLPVTVADSEPAHNYIIDPEMVFRGQSPEEFQVRPQSLDAYGQPIPQNYMEGVSPQGDPFGDAYTTPPGFVDVNIDVTEGRTGRLMFGVGVNSDAGLVGSLVLQEDNFDIMRPPTSFADILNGQAWRGAGQSLRLEAVPGTEVSRYMATWSDPYFLRSDFSLGVSGFYYNRYYENWTEERLGGRISLGYVLSKYWSASTFVRLEDVNISNIPAVNPPPQLVAVKGDNFLSTAGAALQYDARDNSFFPTSGHYANFNYEQGFGDFAYPRFDISGGKFFTTYERPDGFGKQVLSLTGQVGYTGDNTPVFENFFAGGYSSFRGFYFRGVSPEVNGVKIGGNFLALGSAEYMIPLTASDNIRTVVFTDFGTVEPDVSLDDFRVSAGFGFRLTIPAMGPAPLAFDFAWPILKQETDRLRVFSFYVGFNR
ncbi:BamA/OMP85 family outer membrane protein [Planctomicrobium sp. SH661]|uniref:BamA/OMP85 family outer membrane protein n=1 Tax=Planctomicrobium sp. SH661 TaxID=3448124 RepID=UPI003F5AEAE5